MVGLAVSGLAACGSGGGTGKPAPVVVLQSIAITPAGPVLAAGTMTQLTATGMFSDSSTRDLSMLVAWSTTTPDVATVSSTGLLTGVIRGSTSVNASLDGITGGVVISITAAKLTTLQVTPTNPSLAAGTTSQLTAMGIFTDMSKQDLTAQVTWSSDDATHATVSTSGLATAVGVGSANITATMTGISGTTKLTTTQAVLASIAIVSTPTPPSVAKGRSLQLTATGTFTDKSTQPLTTQVTWTSATTTVATIDANGNVTTLATGTSDITAAMNGISKTTTLTVTAAELVQIDITPALPSVAAGLPQQLAATGTFTDQSTQPLTNQVTWDTVDHTIATVSNAAGSNGLATTIKAGTVTVTATLTGVTGHTDLTVTAALPKLLQVDPTNPTVSAGGTQQFHATEIFTDSSHQNVTALATWTSLDTDVATISNDPTTSGLATTLVRGDTTISATFDGLSASTTLSVTDAVLTSIVISPSAASVPAGRSQPFTAQGNFSDGSFQDLTPQATWESDDETVATISSTAPTNGLATTFKPGTVSITASFGGITSDPATLTATAAVLDRIDVTPVDQTLPNGESLQFTAMGTFSDGSQPDITKQVTWGSSNTDVAVISNDSTVGIGLATAVAATGTVDITATLTGVTGKTTLTASAAVLVSIAVTPTPVSVVPTGQQQFTATGTFSDKTTQNLTKKVTWAVADSTIVTISNTSGPPAQGVATGVTFGTTTVTAASGNITSTPVSITVTTPTVASVLPNDGASRIRTTTPIVVMFDQLVDPTTVTTQTTAGPCTGSVQLSANGFTTCIAFAAATATVNTSTQNKASVSVAVAQPAIALSSSTSYQVRVLGTITSPTPASVPVAPFTQPNGFLTSDGATCGTLTISQIYGGGGNSGATLNHDFIELHNGSAAPVSLAGLAVQYAPSTSSSWNATPLPAVILAPGAYFLIQEASQNPVGADLPTADASGTINMAAGSGKIALTASTVPLDLEIPGAPPATMTNPMPKNFSDCPVALTIDFIGYGGADCSEGTPSTTIPNNATSAQRNNGGCTDTDVNKSDFTNVTLAVPPAMGPGPRNTASPASVCTCQ